MQHLYYWLEKEIGSLEIVKIKKDFFEEKLVVTFHGSGNINELIYMKGLKWYGPIISPTSGKSKEKDLPDVPIPPVVCSNGKKE